MEEKSLNNSIQSLFQYLWNVLKGNLSEFLDPEIPFLEPVFLEEGLKQEILNIGGKNDFWNCRKILSNLCKSERRKFALFYIFKNHFEKNEVAKKMLEDTLPFLIKSVTTILPVRLGPRKDKKSHEIAQDFGRGRGRGGFRGRGRGGFRGRVTYLEQEKRKIEKVKRNFRRISIQKFLSLGSAKFDKKFSFVFFSFFIFTKEKTTIATPLSLIIQFKKFYLWTKIVLKRAGEFAQEKVKDSNGETKTKWKYISSNTLNKERPFKIALKNSKVEIPLSLVKEVFSFVPKKSKTFLRSTKICKVIEALVCECWEYVSISLDYSPYLDFLSIPIRTLNNVKRLNIKIKSGFGGEDFGKENQMRKAAYIVNRALSFANKASVEKIKFVSQIPLPDLFELIPQYVFPNCKSFEFHLLKCSLEEKTFSFRERYWKKCVVEMFPNIVSLKLPHGCGDLLSNFVFKNPKINKICVSALENDDFGEQFPTGKKEVCLDQLKDRSIETYLDFQEITSYSRKLPRRSGNDFSFKVIPIDSISESERPRTPNYNEGEEVPFRGGYRRRGGYRGRFEGNEQGFASAHVPISKEATTLKIIIGKYSSINLENFPKLKYLEIFFCSKFNSNNNTRLPFVILPPFGFLESVKVFTFSPKLIPLFFSILKGHTLNISFEIHQIKEEKTQEIEKNSEKKVSLKYIINNIQGLDWNYFDTASFKVFFGKKEVLFGFDTTKNSNFNLTFFNGQKKKSLNTLKVSVDSKKDGLNLDISHFFEYLSSPKDPLIRRIDSISINSSIKLGYLISFHNIRSFFSVNDTKKENKRIKVEISRMRKKKFGYVKKKAFYIPLSLKNPLQKEKKEDFELKNENENKNQKEKKNEENGK